MKEREKASDHQQVIFLAGDSTMQSYGPETPLQAGWGQMLMEMLCGSESFTCTHRQDSPYPQQRSYVSSRFMIDNCAMAGRSTKTFMAEGRLADIRNRLRPGNWLVIQFGHNDASQTIPERHVSPADFQESLQPFVEAACSCGARPVLVSSIAIHPQMLAGDTPAGTIGRQLPAYAKIMEAAAKEWNCPYLDMGSAGRTLMKVPATGYLQEPAAGNAAADRLYLEDGVHLTYEGAKMYARIFSEWLTEQMK